jgi:hypothetical protein
MRRRWVSWSFHVSKQWPEKVSDTWFPLFLKIPELRKRQGRCLGHKICLSRDEDQQTSDWVGLSIGNRYFFLR